MLKRKRDEHDDGGPAGDRNAASDTAHRRISARQQRVNFKLAQGTKKLAHAFKVAKGFERQKLARRRKTAVGQKTPKDVERIDNEIAALKALEITRPAQHHLYKTLTKIKAVAENPDLPKQVKAHGTLSTDVATLNVHARLCSSNPVKECMRAILEDISGGLGLKASSTAAPGKQVTALKERQAEPNSKDKPMDISDGLDSPRGKIKKKALHAYEDSASGEEGDYDAFDHRLAHSEDEGDLSDIDDLERQLASEGIKRAKRPDKRQSYDLAADMSISGTESEVLSSSPEPSKASVPKKSAFIPSLTMGGYISGSGTDIEDEIDLAPRKNRRGQRARQKIWEQKYGAKAKHLHREDRNSGWDPKRGATDGGGGRPAGQRTNRPKTSSANRKVGMDGKASKKRDDAGPIHPSWEAAKKAKERKDVTVSFQGKKTTFE